jgi:hypothetical protein
MSTASVGPHQAVSVEGWNNGVGTSYDPLPEGERGGTVSTIGGPEDAELTKIGQDIARAYATHDMPPGALSALLGGLLAIAGGPFGRASQHAVKSLRNAQKAVTHR